MKWLVPEELREQALRLLHDGGVNPLFAPPFFHAEVSNGLYRQRRRGLISDEEFTEALDRFLVLRVTLVAPTELYRRACELAQSRRLGAVYDSLYVALAQFLGVELRTADQRLLTAVGPVAPWVRWIGEY